MNRRMMADDTHMMQGSDQADDRRDDVRMNDSRRRIEAARIPQCLSESTPPLPAGSLRSATPGPSIAPHSLAYRVYNEAVSLHNAVCLLPIVNVLYNVGSSLFMLSCNYAQMFTFANSIRQNTGRALMPGVGRDRGRG